MSALVALCLVVVVSSALAQSDLPADEGRPSLKVTPTDAGSYRGHAIFFGVVAISAAGGVIGGIVEGQCRGEGFQANILGGTVFLGALVGLFTGGSWGGEDPGPSWHPPEPVGNLEGLRLRTRKGDRIEVQTSDGAIVLGKLVRARKGVVVMKGEQGRMTIPDSSICAIATLRDPSWDGALYGAGAGALFGWVYAERSHKEPGVSVSSGDMALVGGAILGAVGLASDLFHNGRSVVLQRGGCAPYSVGIRPCVSTGGGGLAISLQF